MEEVEKFKNFFDSRQLLIMKAAPHILLFAYREDKDPLPMNNEQLARPPGLWGTAPESYGREMAA